MNFIFKLSIASGILFLFSKPSLSEFVPLKKDETKSCNITLSEAKDISHQCQVIIDRSNSLEVWQERLSFHFGKLSRSEFHRLKNRYSGWSNSKTTVSYDKNRSYQLIDFLPPTIQALDSHRFIPESTEIKDKYTKSLYMNCWGLIYEILRAAKNPLAKPAIFMAQGSIMLDLLRDNSHSLITLKEPEDFPIPNNINQPGDIILIMHKSSTGYEYLDHIAIAIDDGVYFEKAGTGANVPIRIIDEATISKIWRSGVFYYEVIRLKDDAVLPHGREVFSIDSPAIKKEFALSNELLNSRNTNTTIMWEEEESLANSSLFYLINTLPIYLDSKGRAKLNSQLYKPILK